MNSYKNIIAIIIAVLLTSCNDWLDVNPNDTIVEGDLFKSSSGYHNALNGVYLEMSNNSLYGKELSWAGIEALSQTYKMISSIPESHLYFALSKYRQNNSYVESSMQEIWTKSFYCIANCNNILKNIDNAEPKIFSSLQSEKNLIKGEALALRAFLHFDILRLFAPAPINDDGKRYIPYCDTYPIHRKDYQNTDYIITKVIDNLINAQKLVASYDTIGNHIYALGSNSRFSTSSFIRENAPSSAFYAYRGYRMNYFAITAILARVYNYAGLHEEAFNEASKLIELQTAEGDDLFPFTSVNKVELDRKRSSDLIFGLSVPKLFENYEPYRTNTENSIFLTLSEQYFTLFDDNVDYRQKELITKLSSDTWISNIYIKPESNSHEVDVVADIIPMVRISEMFYIVAEYYAKNNQFIKSVEYLDKVRRGRNCTIGRLNVHKYDDFIDELLKEARREFIGEGQLFYYYKKYNIKLVPEMNEISFFFPLPQNDNIN